MRCALAVACAVLLWTGPVFSQPSVSLDRKEWEPLMLRLTFPLQLTVRRAVTLALARLARPGCRDIFEDFALQNGRTPRSELDRLGIEPVALVRSLVFVDGSRNPVCGNGRAVLVTTPGSQVIGVCPGFARLQAQDPSRSACLIIHESLHALGLGENPPSSKEITLRVEHRCS